MDNRKGKKKQGGCAAFPAKITDARFASFQTDPRFRLPSRKHAKTAIDKRFAGVLKDSEFTATARVDKYGRKIKSDSKKKALERLYELEDDEKDDDGDDDDKDDDKDDGEEDEDDDDEKDQEDNDDDDDDEDAELELDDDEVVQRELRAAHEKLNKKYDPAREGGFSSSEDDSDSDADDSDDQGDDLATGGDMQRLEREDIEVGEVTNRIAIVNLDWDHVKSTDLMALFSSFIPPTDGGKILNIAVYPSEFGKERMQQEELEGPPKELFKKGKKDDDSDDDSASDSEAEDAAIKKKLIKEQEGDDRDFDSDALRAYQLDRLRYYYAVMTCSGKSTAKAIYEATDGTEYQSSSNFIDLRFVPDDVDFDDEPRDQCDKIPESYKPIDFVTNALQSSKVKLTWDMHPEEVSRKQSIKRAFKGSRAEIDEQDLRAYLAGDSDCDEEDEEEEDKGEDNGATDGEPKLTKKELARKKMREALGLADESVSKKSKDGPVGEMEVTFTPALTDNNKSKKEDREETTIEKYARKEKERKERKRQAAKAKREGLETSEDAAEQVQQVHDDDDGDDGEDLGFNDPFFTTDDPAPPPSKAAIRKEERRKKREAREAAEARDAEEKAHLAKVMAEDADENRADHLDHFDMNEIMRAEKQKGKKKKHQKKGTAAKEAPSGLQEDFEMDVGDERFKAVFDSHEFAIDPSNPKFKATEGMKKLLEEGRKKRKMAVAGGDGEEQRSSGKRAKKGRR